MVVKTDDSEDGNDDSSSHNDGDHEDDGSDGDGDYDGDDNVSGDDGDVDLQFLLKKGTLCMYAFSLFQTSCLHIFSIKPNDIKFYTQQTKTHCS